MRLSPATIAILAASGDQEAQAALLDREVFSHPIAFATFRGRIVAVDADVVRRP